jgi:lipid A 4'-phosphatase
LAKFHIIWGLVVCFVAWVFFLFFPHLDIAIAGYFYDPAMQSFIGSTSDGILGFLHSFARLFPIFFSIIVILFLLGSLFIAKFRIKHRKAIFFVAVCLWIGPGLVVNYVFKDHWGRPRPVMVQEFDGDKVFQKPFVISNQCGKNCSFVCGDASMGFWVFAFIPLLATRRKKLMAFSAAIVVGGGLGLMRIAQGGHFFSDVIFCGIFVYICTWLVYAVMYRDKEEEKINNRSL